MHGPRLQAALVVCEEGLLPGGLTLRDATTWRVSVSCTVMMLEAPAAAKR